MANSSIVAAFERMWLHVSSALLNKSDISHTHDDRYYTDSEIDSKVSTINMSITNVVDGTTKVGKATTADIATNATNATKATQDASGNVITSTYETKTDSQTKLDEAKSYTDSVKANVKAQLDTKAQVQIITWEADD